MKYKHLLVPPELHKLVKIGASQKGISIIDYLKLILKDKR